MTALDASAAAGGFGVLAPARARRRRAGRPVVLAAAVVVALVVAVAVAPGLFTGHAPNDTAPVDALLGPGGGHWFGTDQLGRDIYTRVLYGTRPALLLGLFATVLGAGGGAVLGLTAALGGRIADGVLMRLVDVLLAVPALLLALLVVAVLGAGTGNVALAVAIASVPPYARLVRAEALGVRRSGYVEAALGLGLPRATLIRRHVVPNTLTPLLVLATVGFGAALVSSSVLSFLGLGTEPPDPEWGSMLAEGRDFLSTAWWIAVFPGATLTVVVFAVNVLGGYARTRFAGRSGS
ncbi:ABC transporter permease [Parafrankia sp. BMG5.11]|uniref:ABC transporter permease n=1 Tax=Parafrankia sp. BMG5.11 TaxID=222540 RepID=UPI000DA48961|nr:MULTISPECIES: ABC transporter permease [unclassified Parafrankia]CAI7979607.1 peptide/nickel transport system permease protein [Frankia sp. Hr75.2]SQD93431.1 ABC transporter dipeptide permease [Parafrankia sp. Ea1.12]